MQSRVLLLFKSDIFNTFSKVQILEKIYFLNFFIFKSCNSFLNEIRHHR